MFVWYSITLAGWLLGDATGRWLLREALAVGIGGRYGLTETWWCCSRPPDFYAALVSSVCSYQQSSSPDPCVCPQCWEPAPQSFASDRSWCRPFHSIHPSETPRTDVCWKDAGVRTGLYCLASSINMAASLSKTRRNLSKSFRNPLLATLLNV